MTITLLGLGPHSLSDLTLAAWRTLTTAQRIILRTARHPCVAELQPHLAPGAVLESCDDLYEQHAEFAAVYQACVARVLAAAQAHGDVVYAVPGHPWVGEATTPLLLAAAAQAQIPTQVIGGLSFVEPAFAAVGMDVMDSGQVLDAMLLAQQHYPQVDAALPLLLGQVYARWLASDVKLVLLAAYPPTHPVTVLAGAGGADAQQRTVPLAELDHSDAFDHLTSVYVPPLPRYSSFSALQELVAHLRAPEGCPWDREQTLASLRKDLLDEAAEVIEAIDLESTPSDAAGDAAGDASGDAEPLDNSAHIAEELGDLYLVATMLTQIAAEEGRFQMADIMRGVVTKLIRRHPHVFGDVTVSGVAHVLANWDAIKAQEKADRGIQPGPLDGVPAALPALQKARKLQSKAAKQGLLDRRALAQRTPALAELLGDQPTAADLGALLWQLVALAHEHELDAEDALREYGVRFRREVG